MKIVKRNGDRINLDMNKITRRIKNTAKGLKVNAEALAMEAISNIPKDADEFPTRKIDNIIANVCANYTSSHYDHSKLAGRIAITSLYKDTTDDILELYTGLVESKIVHPDLVKKINKYGAENITALIDNSRDELFDYFAWIGLSSTYLLVNANKQIVERPQQMYMRVAIWLSDSFEECAEIYEYASKQLISFASPIMINSGTLKSQLASCVLINLYEDSREGMLNAHNDASLFSSNSAGIGFNITPLRSKKSVISTTGGNASGILKYCKMLNEAMRTFDQSGKRAGSCAVYLEPWHLDIMDFLKMRDEHGSEEATARDLFFALWMPDNFVEAVRNDTDWHLFCPNDLIKNGLKPFYDIYGKEYEEEYQKAVDMGLGTVVKAKDIWTIMLKSQIETGMPYVSFKDNANNKSNHKGFGTVKQSNLCNEIFQYTDSETIATCVLSSMVLKNFVAKGKFDFELLRNATRVTTKMLNKVIDINYYSAYKGEKGGKEQRAIGIGVQGLADTFFLMDYVFTSEEARKLNKDIMETIYFSALEKSNELAKDGIYPKYHKYEDSPFAEGIFQFDMWGLDESQLSQMWDWKTLRENGKLYGFVNSMLTALMPTAGSSKITNSYESFEPIGSNFFRRNVNGGSITIANKYLVEDLEKLGIWSEDIKLDIIVNRGSIQNIQFEKYIDITDQKNVKRINHLKDKYKTIYETKQKDLIEMSRDRGYFVDQSQSLNLYMTTDPNLPPLASRLSGALIYAHQIGLKTGLYYLRSKAISTGSTRLAFDESKLNSNVNNTPTITEENNDLDDESPFTCAGGGCSA